MGDSTLNSVVEELDEQLSPSSSDTFIEIEIAEKATTNKFTAKYKLVAVGNSDKEAEITNRVPRNSDLLTEITPRAIGIVDKDVFIDIKYRGYLDALVEIQPIGHHNIPTEIEIRPHNRMVAIYEVQQPPIVTDVFKPTQDSFTRENKSFETINYGGNSSMVAGISGDDIWRSFIQFDLESINPSYILTESHLRLYYKGTAPTHVKLEIYNADQAWLEYSITNLNRPNPIELITDEFTVNTDYGYIEFNVSDIVEDWVAKRIINNGFLMRVSNETILGQAIFHTRESMFPPELVVKYYDSRIFSQGRSQFVTEIFIMKRDDSDVLVTIEPSSIFSNNDIETEIYCHQVDVPLDSDILVEVLANIPIVESEITASIRGEIEAWVTIDARLPNDNSVNAEITASRDKTQAEVTPAFRNTIEGDVEITVTVPCIYTEITVFETDNSDIDVEVEVNEISISSHDIEITVSKEAISTEVSARVSRKQDIYTVITVSRPKLEAEVEVKYRSDVLVEIEPNIKSDVLVSIIASRPEPLVELSVFGYEKLEELAEIDIRVFDQVEAEIYVFYRSDINIEIDAKSVSQINVEITANKPNVHSQIVIPTWVDQDLPTEIQPRILMVSNMYTVIQVGSAGGAYAFII